MTTSLRRSIAVSLSLLAAWGFGAAPAHPRDPKSDSLPSGAGKTGLSLAAALRGRHAPSLASLVAIGCFLASCVIRIYNTITTGHFDRTQSRIFLDFLFNYEKYYSMAFLVKTGPYTPNVFSTAVIAHSLQGLSRWDRFGKRQFGKQGIN